MPHVDLNRLRCPVCHGGLAFANPDALTCQSNHRYPIVNGIPELMPASVLKSPDVVSESKRQERHSHDTHAPELDYALPVDEQHLFAWLNYYQLFEMRPALAAAQPQSILAGMVGPGFELEIWRTLSSDVSGMDISTGLARLAAGRADALGLTGAFVAGDIEHIPFGDGVFDLVVVHHGLHHLPSLERSLGELLRVTRRHCLICEPVDGPMRKLLRKTGLSPGVEPGGTRVCDIVPAEVGRIAARHGARVVLEQHVLYPRARVARPTGWYVAADRLRVPQLLRLPLKGFNTLLGRWTGTKGTFLLDKGAATSAAR